MSARRLGVMLLVLLGAVACTLGAPRHDGSLQLLVVIDHTPQRAFLGDPSHPYRRHAGYRVAPRVERTLDRLAAEYGIKRQLGWPIPAIDAHCEVFVLPHGASLASVMDRVEADPDVKLAQPMQEHDVMGTAQLTVTYNDPYLDMQHALETMRVADAHAWSRGKGVRIAVVDTGIQRTHDDLRHQVTETHSFVPRQYADSKGVHHGTAVAGVIASVANNDSGIVGVAPEAKLLDLRACWPRPESSGRAMCNSLSLARALSAAIEANANVINLSLAGPSDPLVANLIRRAFAAGIVLVAAAGPPESKTLRFPASMAEVLAADLPTTQSRRALVAPGQDVLTTTPSGYDFVSGSSISAAHVSGLVALLKAHVPTLDPTSIGKLFERFEAGQPVLDACAILAAGSGHGLCRGPQRVSVKTPMTD